MKLIIDVVLLAIIALCTWGGYKRGLVGGVAGVLAIIIAVFGGTLLSSAYAGEVVPALEPFVDGYVDSQKSRDQMLENMGYGDSDLSLEDIIAEDPSLRYDYASEAMRLMGFHEKRTEELADKAIELSETTGASLTEAIVAVLCDTITYVAGLTIAFLLILILLIAFANVLNLSLRLPNMETLDEVGGAVIGFAQGFVYCVFLAWFLSFFGIIIGRGTLENTVLAKFFLSFEFITKGLL